MADPTDLAPAIGSISGSQFFDRDKAWWYRHHLQVRSALVALRTLSHKVDPSRWGHQRGALRSDLAHAAAGVGRVIGHRSLDVRKLDAGAMAASARDVTKVATGLELHFFAVINAHQACFTIVTARSVEIDDR